MKLTIDVNGTEYFYTLNGFDAEIFFNNNTLDLGPLNAGAQDVELSYSLVFASNFGFTYDLSLVPPAVPEPATWAMMLWASRALASPPSAAPALRRARVEARMEEFNGTSVRVRQSGELTPCGLSLRKS